jgi:predicted ester cyclase
MDATQLVRRWHDIWDKRSPEIADEILTADFIDHTFRRSAPDLPAGPEGVKQVARMSSGMTSEITTTLDDVFAAGDKIAARVTVHSIPTGEWQTPIGRIPGTGQPMTHTQMEIFRVSGDRLAEHWEEVDMVTIMQQAGVRIAESVATAR